MDYYNNPRNNYDNPIPRNRNRINYFSNANYNNDENELNSLSKTGGFPRRHQIAKEQVIEEDDKEVMNSSANSIPSFLKESKDKENNINTNINTNKNKTEDLPKPTQISQNNNNNNNNTDIFMQIGSRRNQSRSPSKSPIKINQTESVKIEINTNKNQKDLQNDTSKSESDTDNKNTNIITNNQNNALSFKEKKSKKLSSLLSNPKMLALGAVSTVGALAATIDEITQQELDSLRSRIKIEIESHENDIEYYKKLLASKENEYKVQILELQNELLKAKNAPSNNSANELLLEKLRLKEQELNNEINRLKQENDFNVRNALQKQEILHREQIRELEEKHKKEIDKLRQDLLNQNSLYERQLKQDMELSKINNNVQDCSKQIQDILMRLFNENEGILNTNKSYKNEFELLEERLRRMEDDLKIEKEIFNKNREEFENEVTERKKQNLAELSRIKSESDRLEKLRIQYASEHQDLKSNLEKNKMLFDKLSSDKEYELETLKSNYQIQLNELEYQKAIFEEEKKHFDKSKKDFNNDYNYKKIEFEKRKALFLQKENDFDKRNSELMMKESYYNDKLNELNKLSNELKEKEDKINKDKNDIMTAAKRLEESSKEIDNKNYELEKEKERLRMMKDEIEGQKIGINNDKLKNEQDKVEIKMRMQSVDMLRMKYVNEPMLVNAINFNNNIDNNGGSNDNFNNTFNGNLMNNNNNYSQISNGNLMNKTMYNINTNNNLKFNIGNIGNNSFNYLNKYGNNISSSDYKINRASFNADDKFNAITNNIKNKNILENDGLNGLRLGMDINGSSGINGISDFIANENDFIKKSTESLINNNNRELNRINYSNTNNYNISKTYGDYNVNFSNINDMKGKSIQFYGNNFEFGADNNNDNNININSNINFNANVDNNDEDVQNNINPNELNE